LSFLNSDFTSFVAFASCPATTQLRLVVDGADSDCVFIPQQRFTIAMQKLVKIAHSFFCREKDEAFEIQTETTV